jgi:hypothetical protein
LFLDKTKKDDRTAWSWLLGPPEDGTMRMVVDIFQLAWVLVGMRRGAEMFVFLRRLSWIGLAFRRPFLALVRWLSARFGFHES